MSGISFYDKLSKQLMSAVSFYNMCQTYLMSGVSFQDVLFYMFHVRSVISRCDCNTFDVWEIIFDVLLLKFIFTMYL